MNKEILKLKCISSIQKLILLQIDAYPEVVKKFMGGYNVTCTELAKELGTTRSIILKEFQKLIELDYITSVVMHRARTTNFTEKFEMMLMLYESFTTGNEG